MCDEFFSLPLFPQALCDDDAMRARNLSCTCGNYASTTGLGCSTSAYSANGRSGNAYSGCGCGCNR